MAGLGAAWAALGALVGFGIDKTDNVKADF